MKINAPFKTALVLWGLISLLVVATISGVILLRGVEGLLNVAIQRGPFSNLPVTLSSVVIAWALAGLLLYLLATNRIRRDNGFTFAGFYLVALTYLNFLRERAEYGDIQYYTQAAINLFNRQPLPEGYLYPPLLASILEPLAPFGETVIFVVVWLANILGLFLFYFLLAAALRRYGFSTPLAALTTTLFLMVNAPLTRTLVYMQVNLHTMNLILLGFLLFRKKPFFSAFLFALAVHLKASPIVLALAFLLEWNARWILYFGLSLILISLPTVLQHGFSPYLDFLNNAALLADAHRISFRDNSFDGLFTVIGEALNLDVMLAKIMAYASKLILACAALWIAIRGVRNSAFDSKNDAPALSNSLPPLFVLMTLSAPVMWEHHGIFLSLSFLLLLKRMNKTGDWLWFGAAYFLEYLLPTFDFFPFSYGRLVAPLIILWLMARLPAANASPPLFEKIESFLHEKL